MNLTRNNSDFRFNYSLLPAGAVGSLTRYVEEGVPTGDFLKCVISNDLSGACSHADNINIHLIPIYVAWLYNHAPAGCWGSASNYKNWLRDGYKRNSSLQTLTEERL